MTGIFLTLWVSVCEAGVKVGQKELREIIHINPGSAQGTATPSEQGVRIAAAHGSEHTLESEE